MEITLTGRDVDAQFGAKVKYWPPQKRSCGGQRDQKKSVSGDQWGSYVRRWGSVGGYWRRPEASGRFSKLTWFQFTFGSHLSLFCPRTDQPPRNSIDIMCIYFYLYVQYKTRWVIECTVDSTPRRPPGGSGLRLPTLKKLNVSRDLTNRCAEDKDKLETPKKLKERKNERKAHHGGRGTAKAH